LKEPIFSMKKRAAPTRWHKLDNTANIFPVVASRRYSNVFRLTAVMREAVDPALLQQALEQTLPYFAAFNVRLRHGLFWNYLETNRATPQVLPEQDAPCRYIDRGDRPLSVPCAVLRQPRASGDLPRAHRRHGRDRFEGRPLPLLPACPPAFTPEQLATPRHRDRGRGAGQYSSITFRPKAKRSANRRVSSAGRAPHRGELGVATALMPVDALGQCRRFGATVGNTSQPPCLRRVRRIHGLQRRKKARQHLCPGESAAYLRHRDVPEFLFQPDDHPAAGAPRRPL
ncbi:MAG: hypothetical protein ACLR7U_15115, partial [Ruthenibacterium lactatiformans]